MNVFLPLMFRRGAIRAVGLLVAIALGGSTVIAAQTPSPNTTPVGKPAVRKMSELTVAATIHIGKVADWVAVTSQGVWVGSKKPNSVAQIDPGTNRVTTIAIPGEACAGLAADAQNLWVPLCGPAPKLAKIDLKTHVLVHVFDVGPAGPEGGIAIGAGRIWLVTDKEGSLVAIDPASGSILLTVHVPPGSYNPVFAAGRIWITRAEGSELTSVDATSGKVLQHFTTGVHPRFLTAGGGAIWTVGQGDGSLSRIDVEGQRPVLKLQLHTPGVGGDITYADGRIWTTLMKTPLSIVDAAKAVVLCQWKGAGGDAIGVGYGTIWLTSYAAGTISRIALSDLPEQCRPATTL